MINKQRHQAQSSPSLFSRVPLHWSYPLTASVLLGTTLIGLSVVKSPLLLPQPANSAVRSSAASLPGNQWNGRTQTANRLALIRAINYSLRYLQSGKSAGAYQRLGATTGITRARVRRSLIRFRTLLKTSRSLDQLQSALQREFVCYQSTGQNENRLVAFTGYYEPIYVASRVRTSTFRYPLYRVPRSFSRWPQPPPTRVQLEGVDGLHPAPYLRGAELVWLRDRLEAYLVQVEGSARLRLADGSTMSVGYAGHTSYAYTSMGRELVKDGKITFAALTQQALIQYFRANPAELNNYLPRNHRFVFVRETRGAPATGSLGMPLTPEHSIATDKSLMPPGALALIQVHIVNPYARRVLKTPKLTRFVLDQDTGSAIKGPDRVDVYMGTGVQAGERAGVINSTGHLLYVLLKEPGELSARGVSRVSARNTLVPVPFPEL